MPKPKFRLSRVIDRLEGDAIRRVVYRDAWFQPDPNAGMLIPPDRMIVDSSGGAIMTSDKRIRMTHVERQLAEFRRAVTIRS